MKILFLTTLMIFSVSASAGLSYSNGMEGIPDEARLSSARACFEELAVLGCGHPKDDLKHFKSCLENNSESLTPSCQQFSQRLYGPRDE